MGTSAERFPEKLTQISPKKCLRAAGAGTRQRMDLSILK